MEKYTIKYYKLNLFDYLLLLLLILIFFSGLLKNYNYVFSYIDEILEILLILLAFPKLIGKKSKTDSTILLLIIVFNVIGIIGSLLWKYNFHFFSMLIDLLAYQKFFLIYICAKIILQNKNIDKYYHYAEKICKFLILCGAFLYLLILFKPDLINWGIIIENGVKVFQIGGHPSYTCALFALITSILLYNHKKNVLWILASLSLCSLTMRSKAFGFVALVFYLVFFSQKKVSFLKIFIMIIPILIVGYDDLSLYFLSNQDASRIRLLRTSVEIANDHVPIGTGFATYGTPMSTRYVYSSVYDKYGLSNSWGFSRTSNSWIGDGGWASIIGQFGYGGLLIIILILINIAKGFNIKRVIKDKKLFMPILAIIGYIFISSTNESFFANDYSLLYAISLALFFHISNFNDSPDQYNDRRIINEKES